MTVLVRSGTSCATNSFETGLELGRKVRSDFEGSQLKGVVAYSTVNHDQSAFLQGIREALGAAVPVIGCSSQGIVGRGTVVEEGYAAGAMGLGGDSLDLSTSHVEDFQLDTKAKGEALGRALREASKGPLRAVVVHYDPLCGADVETFLKALHQEVGCPIIGGAAAEFWGPMQQTFQYAEGRALNRAAVGVGLSGSCTIEMDLCHGTSPVGIEMTVTKADSNKILEFDG
ncbi:MAG TPA: FIST N-terminal domain-containing protein, partial [Polyangiaceae bacterium]|nr:FIST N-terminal domain-containing protein [Polyangiaceae bacterium]